MDSDQGSKKHKKRKKVKLNFFKSLWRQKPYATWTFICPVCEARRCIPVRSEPAPEHFFQIGLTSVFFTLLTWPWLNWKGIVSFLPFWITFEVIYRLRVRGLVHCPHCGFDPYLFLSDEDKAKSAIEAHIKKKYEPLLKPLVKKETPPPQG